MKSLCVILLLSLSMPGCSMFTKSGRQDRAYYKQLKQVKRARERQRSRIIRQRAEMPSLRTPPPLQENAQPPENH